MVGNDDSARAANPLAVRPELIEMSSVPRRRGRASLVAMIAGGLLAIAPVFGPLGKTWHYLGDFFAERPQSMRGPDASFYFELLALVLCPVGLLIFVISLVFFLRAHAQATKADG